MCRKKMNFFLFIFFFLHIVDDEQQTIYWSIWTLTKKAELQISIEQILNFSLSKITQQNFWCHLLATPIRLTVMTMVAVLVHVLLCSRLCLLYEGELVFFFFFLNFSSPVEQLQVCFTVCSGKPTGHRVKPADRLSSKTVNEQRDKSKEQFVFLSLSTVAVGSLRRCQYSAISNSRIWSAEKIG